MGAKRDARKQFTRGRVLGVQEIIISAKEIVLIKMLSHTAACFFRCPPDDIG